MFDIQRPARWLFDALGIISGGVPLRMWRELQATVDVVQGGHGLADGWVWGRTIANVGVPGIDNPIPSSEADTGKYAWLFRVTVENADSAAVFCTVNSSPTNGPGSLRLLAKTIPANTDYPWDMMAPGIGQFLYVPPLAHLNVVMAATATAACVADWQYLRVPAGTKPW